ncbi:MAG: signal peptide peptidase SppA, partial [Candidatus Cloacimonetes bacterium]|nr:signal peptide peptidase SppA [Candidatus Cloacimonadota bacterium]
IRAGFATLNEIIFALENFKNSGKEVISYLDFCGNKDYFLASCSNKIYLNPSASAGILLTGVGTDILFYKDLLDKLGIEMQVVHAGKFKGAGEPFTRNQISRPFRESIENLFGDIYQQMIEKIAERREMQAAEIKRIYEERSEIFINMDNALSKKLVDGLAFREDLFSQKGIEKENLISLEDYRLPSLKLSFNNNIAILYAQGSIAASKPDFETRISASKINKILDKLQKDNSVKAVVIRVNSPGGSALESEIILQKIKKVREHKPVVISMGNVAASGGYYIACDSDHTLADPFTITGSIGVVGIFPNFNKLGDKAGIYPNVIKKGKYSNLLDPWQKPDPNTMKAFENEILDTYDEFKNRVAKGREINLNEVERIAQGRIWSSEDALQNKLIDQIGNLDDAVKKAAELADISNYSNVYFPEQKSIIEVLLKENFNIDILTTIKNNKINKEIGLDKAIKFYNNIKEEPIQAIISAEMEL